jgi:hypothetical protein
MNGITIGIFAAILALTLAITAWAAHPHGDRFLRGGQGPHGGAKWFRLGG